MAAQMIGETCNSATPPVCVPTGTTWSNNAAQRPKFQNVAFDFADYSKALRPLDTQCVPMDADACAVAAWWPGQGTPYPCQCRNVEHEFNTYASVESSLTKSGAAQTIEWWEDQEDNVGARLSALGSFETQDSAVQAAAAMLTRATCRRFRLAPSWTSSSRTPTTFS